MTGYLGFGINRQQDRIVRLFGEAPETPARFEPVGVGALSPLEKEALERDRSPALYHWNNLIFIPENSGRPEVVYARGKDFLPFGALDYVEQLRCRLNDPGRGPATLQIQPNQVCNDACTFCCTEQYRKLPIYKGKRFSKEQLMQLLARHADGGGEVVEIIGGGEPTLLPYFVEILRFIAERGMRAYLFTNGSRFARPNGDLDYALLEAIAESCVLLNVSLDGYRQRQLVHRRLGLDTTMQTYAAMEYINRIRNPRKMGFYNSYILTGGSRQASNLDDLYEAVERQAGWVDSIHIQNDFVSMSHREFDAGRTREILQRTIDDFFDKTYLYFNYPLIERFGLCVPYDLSLHNVSSKEFPRCPRALVAPTVECGSFKVWPCGKYSGEAQPEDQHTFESIPDQMTNMRRSADFKNGLSCDPCIHSSYNLSLLEIEKRLSGGSKGEFFHYYEKGFVERTCAWGTHRGLAQAAGRATEALPAK